MTRPWSTAFRRTGRGIFDGRSFISDRHAGFTILEVLVAVIVLFSVLTSATLAFRSANRLLKRLELRVRIEDAAPAARANIRRAMEEQQLQGEGVIAPDLEYNWQAVKKSSAPNVLASDTEFGEGKMLEGIFTMMLYDVDLTISGREQGVSGKREYHYLEFLWSRRGQGDFNQ